MEQIARATGLEPLSWDAPGPGTWIWLGSHIPGAPTPIYRDLHIDAVETGVGQLFERYGVPLRTMRESTVNGKLYSRLEPLFGADKEAAAPPPAAILWLFTRLHPAFRKRAKTSA